MRNGETRHELTVASAQAAAATAARSLGLDERGIYLLRMGENATFHLPRGGIVARVARSLNLLPRVQREIDIALHLDRRGFPATKVLEGVNHPIKAESRLVTFWKYVPGDDRAPRVQELGALLHAFHAISHDHISLPYFDPFSVVPMRLASPGEAHADDVEFLRLSYESLKSQYSSLTFPRPLTMIHGDAHLGNVLHSLDGPILTDFEVCAFGPVEWDAIPTSISKQRFGLSTREYGEFSEAFGTDVTAWADYRILKSVRELTMTTWLMQLVSVSEAHAREFSVRMQSLRTGDDEREWRAL